MNILFLHNKYLISGGEDVSTNSEIELLKKHGHHVEAIIIDNQQVKDMSKIRLIFHTIWSRSIYKKVKDELRAKKYDIVHVQNFFPLISPSVFYAAKASRVKIIMSVRNYRLICPNALLYVNDQICTKCIGKKIPYPGAINKCYRESFAASFVSMLMLSVHNLMSTWNKKVDGYICISNFVKSQMVLGGIDINKLFIKYNFISEDLGFNQLNDDYYLYVGRLSTEKGIKIMVDAFKEINKKGGSKKLIVIGDGPLADYVISNAEDPQNNISYLGRKPAAEAYKYMRNAKFLVFPSNWNEPFGRTIVEAFSNGTPVIGSGAGGVTELVLHGINGFLYEAGNLYSLISVIEKQDEFDYSKLRINARESYVNYFTPEKNYEEVMKIYKNVIEN